MTALKKVDFFVFRVAPLNFDPAVEALTKGKIKFTIDNYSENGLNYLDLNLKYDCTGKLQFSVFTKETTKLNYLNSGSLHHPKQIKNVAPGAIKRLVFFFCRTFLSFALKRARKKMTKIKFG